MSYFIGVHYGHNATVCVMKNGKVIFYQSEERKNRLKNSTGFPSKTLDYVFKNICSRDVVERLAFSQRSISGYRFIKRQNFKSIQYGNYLSSEDRVSGFFKNSALRWNLQQFLIKKFKDTSRTENAEAEAYWCDITGLPRDKLVYVDHHETHALSAVPLAEYGKEYLVFTADGVGDYASSTVSLLKDTKLECLSSVDHKNSLGYFYSAITALMGMKSGEHEFKVMGLAPYSNPEYYRPILSELQKLLSLDEHGEFRAEITPNKLHKVLGNIIQHKRFDNVAGAIQELTELLLREWVLYWVQKTGVRRILLAGGVMMNVKACQVLASLDEVQGIRVVPSAADESTALGAAVYLSCHGGNRIEPLTHLYLGQEFSDAECLKEIKSYDEAEGDIIFSQPKNIAKKVASLLANNQIVARCAGPMEFGARALGNRSILANPADFATVEEINATIKIRDFWMPFTPSILSTDMGRYIVNPKEVQASYMSITFDTTTEAKRDLKAAIHPRDKTARPQCVYESWNKPYFDIISEFKAMTDIGAVLNTSFNLHGEPNVCSPKDALDTFKNSDLRWLVLGSYLVEKKKHTA